MWDPHPTRNPPATPPAAPRHVQSTPDVRLTPSTTVRLALRASLLLGAAVAPAQQPTPAPTQPQQQPQTQGQPITPRAPRPAPAPPGRLTVFLDPAHGGDDPGARLPDGSVEKDITLDLATRLRAQITSLGLATLLTRDADTAPPTPNQPNPALPTPDQRAGLANHAHPFACIILHATGSGTGIHVITANLQPTPSSDLPDSPAAPLPWDSAQLDSLPQSERLATSLTDALTHAGLSATRGRAVIRPLISLTCPAVLLEFAPLSRTTGPRDASYQARAAQAIATTLLLWHNLSDPAPTSTNATPAGPTQ